MYCPRCGREIEVDIRYCPYCGAAVKTEKLAVQSTSTLAIASLITGIAGFTVLPVVGSILAVILGKNAIKEINTDDSLKGIEMAKSGIIIGWIGIIFTGVIVLLVLAILTIGIFSTGVMK
jgi:hypothetical protein